MDMEERSYPRTGGVGVQQLTDVELNDVEYPQFVNSSLSDDEDLGENNNLTSSSYCAPNARKIFPIPVISTVMVPPKIRPPPVSTSSSCFVANVLRSVQENNNNAKTAQDAVLSVQSLQKTLSKTASDGQREVLQKFERRNEKRSELIKLKESIHQHQIQKKTLGQEYTELLTSCAERVSASKAKLTLAQCVHKKGEDRLKDKMQAKDILKKQLEHAKRKMEEVSREDAELYDWTRQHCITVHMKSRNSSSSPDKEEVVIQLHNVNPLKPEQQFHVLAESVTLNRFCIGNVFPEFEEAYDVIERANESQDLILLLRDCMKYWKRDCEKSLRHSDKLCESIKLQSMIVDQNQTVELFESPHIFNK